MRRAVLRGVLTATMLAVPGGGHALDIGSTLDKLAFPPDTLEKVLAGSFVQTALGTSTERDVGVGIAFLVEVSPEELVRRLREERVLENADPGMIAFGPLEGEGTAAQLARLELTPAQRRAFAAARPGDDLNLSAEEIAALDAVGPDGAALQRKVHELLLARYDAYRTRGIAGMAPYARKDSSRRPAEDLAHINRVVREAGVLPLEFCTLLEDYPRGAPADLVESFYWSQFASRSGDTIALTHYFLCRFGDVLIAVQRQFYASTGYNVEQAIAGFFPVEQGTLVLYGNHTSTDRVAGFGAGLKRGIGRKVMANQLESMFETIRTGAAE